MLVSGRVLICKFWPRTCLTGWNNLVRFSVSVMVFPVAAFCLLGRWALSRCFSQSRCGKEEIFRLALVRNSCWLQIDYHDVGPLPETCQVPQVLEALDLPLHLQYNWSVLASGLCLSVCHRPSTNDVLLSSEWASKFLALIFLSRLIVGRCCLGNELSSKVARDLMLTLFGIRKTTFKLNNKTGKPAKDWTDNMVNTCKYPICLQCLTIPHVLPISMARFRFQAAFWDFFGALKVVNKRITKP